MHKKSTEQTIYRPIYNTFKQCCVIQDHWHKPFWKNKRKVH